MNQQQKDLIDFLSKTNQSLLNQVRAKDLASLSGLQQMTNGESEEDQSYISTDDRELAAYYESMSQAHLVGTSVGIGDELTQEDLDTFRNGL